MHFLMLILQEKIDSFFLFFCRPCHLNSPWLYHQLRHVLERNKVSWSQIITFFHSQGVCESPCGTECLKSLDSRVAQRMTDSNVWLLLLKCNETQLYSETFPDIHMWYRKNQVQKFLCCLVISCKKIFSVKCKNPVKSLTQNFVYVRMHHTSL